MDDKDLFATPTPTDQINSVRADDWHREQARKAHDIIRVTNPLILTIKGQPFEVPVNVRPQLSPQFALNGDYIVNWDGSKYRIPLNGVYDIDRYIAREFRNKMCTAIINYYGQVLGEKRLETEGRNKPEILTDKYLENIAVWSKVPRTDDEKLMAEIWPQLWLGVVRQNGLDTVEDIPSPSADFRTTQEKLEEQLDNLQINDRFQPTITPTLPASADLEADLALGDVPQPPLYVSKKEREKLTKEVTNDN